MNSNDPNDTLENLISGSLDMAPFLNSMGHDPLDSNQSFDADWREEVECEEDYPYEHDDMYDTDSALGSCGWGTDEYYDW